MIEYKPQTGQGIWIHGRMRANPEQKAWDTRRRGHAVTNEAEARVTHVITGASRCVKHDCGIHECAKHE